MSAVSVNTPYPTFLDIDGQPLEDGYVWIGVTGLEPQANPQTAYWDAALTLTATQPVRTRGGYPLDGAAIGRLYTAAPYSIKVQNKRTSTIVLDLTGAAGSGVGSISFGSTGLTPATPTDGDVVVAGTLAVANGGTGVTTATGTGSVVRATSPTLSTSLIVTANAGAVTPSVFGGNTIISTHGADGTAARQMLAGYGGSLSFDFRRALGTAAAPTTITSGQVLGSITWSGYNGSAYTNPRGQLSAVATENWTTGANGTYLSFQLTPRGTATATEVAAFEDNGQFNIGRAALAGPAPSSAAPSRLLVSTNTYTDNTTAASGTVANAAVASVLSNTLAASNVSVTYTSAASVFIAGAPTAGTNVTITNPWALKIDLGNAYLGDRVDGNPANVDSVGFRGVPVNSQSAAYQLVASDAGKSIVHPISDNNARTFTIPANGTVPFPIGTTITFINMINTVTIAITADTMYLAGAGTTGSRTLAAYGMATAVKVTATSWIISGNNLT